MNKVVLASFLCFPGLESRHGLDMQNDAGEFMVLNVPWKCSVNNHASIQMDVAEVDRCTGQFNGQYKTYAICGTIHRMGESDDSILRLAKADGIVLKNF
ncbi:40S ribosomal protein S21-like [Mesocricetus auratus]|uniref:40S ribosomal protein S21-like n=1 Tax=Mesocricetus auratus TaxID=10036 RepID=A0ABM2W9Q4_MESAU|nr:40S ribosomal protein S21-like [Mesocricetus auratus]